MATWVYHPVDVPSALLLGLCVELSARGKVTKLRKAPHQFQAFGGCSQSQIHQHRISDRSLTTILIVSERLAKVAGHEATKKKNCWQPMILLGIFGTPNHSLPPISPNQIGFSIFHPGSSLACTNLYLEMHLKSDVNLYPWSRDVKSPTLSCQLSVQGNEQEFWGKSPRAWDVSQCKMPLQWRIKSHKLPSAQLT